MRPRLVLLLALVTFTIAFMAFLVNEKTATKTTCQKGVCTESPAPAAESGGGSDVEMENGSFHHLIVSTIK